MLLVLVLLVLLVLSCCLAPYCSAYVARNRWLKGAASYLHRFVQLPTTCVLKHLASLLGKIEMPQLTRGTDIATCVMSTQVRTVSARRCKGYCRITMCHHVKVSASPTQDSCLARLANTLLRLSSHPNEHCWFCRLELKRLGVTVALQLQQKMENQPPATPLLLQHDSLLGRTENALHMASPAMRSPPSSCHLKVHHTPLDYCTAFCTCTMSTLPAPIHDSCV